MDKVLTNNTRTVGKEAEATDLPMAGIGLTESGRTQLANSAKNSTLPVAATRCRATRSTTAIADCVVVYSAIRKHMGRPLTTTSIKQFGDKLVAIEFDVIQCIAISLSWHSVYNHVFLYRLSITTMAKRGQRKAAKPSKTGIAGPGGGG